MPPAAEVEHYEHVLPGAADRLFVMAEKALDHKMNVEDHEARTADRAFFAATIGVAYFPWIFIAAAIALVALDAETLAVVAGMIGVISGFGPPVIQAAKGYRRRGSPPAPASVDANKK